MSAIDTARADRLTMGQALDAYRDAVASRAFWEDHGHYGDPNLAQARERESAARLGVWVASPTSPCCSQVLQALTVL